MNVHKKYSRTLRPLSETVETARARIFFSRLFKRFPRTLDLYEESLRRFFSVLPNNGVRVVDEYWDYLLILDACRFDYFRRFNRLNGDLKAVNSLASDTCEWRDRNFTQKNDDIVYISGHPFISNINFHGFKGSDYFHRVYDVWDYGWDDKLNTVHPRVIGQEVMRITQKHKDKRFIVHYVQPHYPFIGSSEHFIVDMKPGKLQVEGKIKGHRAIRYKWLMLSDDSIFRIKKAYAENLVFVLEYLEDTIYNLQGKIVITADHGEAFGEKGVFSHPYGIHIKELIEVPWFIFKP